MSDPFPDTSRIEVKFVAAPTHYHNLLGWFRTHPAGFHAIYPDRRVNNVYFDTHDCSAFAENLSGASARTKVRYRWYGDSDYPDAGTLEVKKKRNCHGWKLKFDVGESPYRPGADWEEIRRSILRRIPGEAKRWLLSNPIPVIINRYFRKYLFSADHRIRVTVDTDLGAWEQRLKPFPNVEYRANTPDVIVVEFKLDRGDYESASRAIQGLPIRQSRHSKYVAGVKAIARI